MNIYILRQIGLPGCLWRMTNVHSRFSTHESVQCLKKPPFCLNWMKMMMVAADKKENSQPGVVIYGNCISNDSEPDLVSVCIRCSS